MQLREKTEVSYLKHRVSCIQLEYNAADTPHITWIWPAKLCRTHKQFSKRSTIMKNHPTFPQSLKLSGCEHELLANHSRAFLEKCCLQDTSEGRTMASRVEKGSARTNTAATSISIRPVCARAYTEWPPSNSIWPYLSSDLVRSEREYC